LEKVIIDVEFDTNPYYAEGYNNGYEAGGEQGYVNGFTNGVEEQKNKLEPITITENGSYSREDGYNEVIVDVPDTNGSYDEGYSDGYINGDGDGYHRGYVEGETNGVENAGEIIAQTAQVLNITENGNYLTQYSEPIIPEIVTGVYPDGTEFYDYVQLNETAYNTQIIPNENTRVEFWYRYSTNNTDFAKYLTLWGTQQQNKGTNGIFKIVMNRGNFRLEYDSFSFHFDLTPSEFHHIIMSKADGLIVDGEQLTTINKTFNPTTVPISINCLIDYTDNDNYTDGEFGMIKITSDGIENVFIPTSNGFINQTTGEYLELVKGGVYEFVNKEPIYGEGNLIKTINVNVIPKINPNNYNLKFAYSSFTSLPEWVEWEKITEYGYLFYNCQQLKDISLIKKINGKSLDSTFQGCTSIKGDDIKHLDISNVTNMSYTFYQTGLDYFPSLDTSNVTEFNYCFAGCNQLKYVEPIDTSKATNFSQMFYDFSGVKALERLPEFDCTNVTSISQYFCYDSYKDKLDNLTDVGGWKNLKIDWTSYGLNCCRNLSYQSCINVLNGLYDFRGNGDATTTRTLKVHQNFIDLVGDEISIATNKGWQITA
jgi:surface protein